MNEIDVERNTPIPPMLFGSDAQRDILCFDLFFNDGPFGLIILNADYHVVKTNSRSEGMLGWSAAALQDSHLETILDGEDVLRLKYFFQNSNLTYDSLIANMSFLLPNFYQPRDYTVYVRRFLSEQKHTHYCLLLFEQDFTPIGSRKERDQQLYDMILETQEQERQHIGELLHNSVAQLLYGMRLNLQYFLKNQPNFAQQIQPIKGMLNDAISAIRDLSMDLSISMLTDFGLKSAVQSMAERVSVPDFTVKAHLKGSDENLSAKCRLTVYRVTQELLNNVIKHAHATHADVKISIKKKGVTIEVKDDGIGFSLENASAVLKGSGLRGIRNRIKPYNGQISTRRVFDQFVVEVTLRVDQNTWEK